MKGPTFDTGLRSDAFCLNAVSFQIEMIACTW